MMIVEVLTSDIETLTSDFKENILSSDVDYHIALRKLHKVLGEVFSDDEVHAKAKLQIGNNLNKYGCSAYVKSNSELDYSNVDHVELTHIEKAMQILAGRQKAILTMLKELPEGEVIETTINGYPTLVENELERPVLIKVKGPKSIPKPSSPVFSFPKKKS